MDRVGVETLRHEADEARARGVDRQPADLMRWALDLLGSRLMMSTAFGKGGMCLLNMMREIAPGLPIYFLDTGFHFAETLQFVDTLREKWGIQLILKRPRLFGASFEKAHGAKLYETNPDLCCHLNKVEPFEEILKEYQGWITAVRRDQGSTRAQAESIEILEGGMIKIQPLVHWTRADVEEYIEKHDIPLHPLFSEGYTSIGCAPCTRPATDAGDERSGRWVGLAKRECGLHTSWKARKTGAGSTDGAPSPAKAPAGEDTAPAADG